MPSSWNVYYVIFLSAVLALGIPIMLAFISRLVSPGARKKRMTVRVLDEVTRDNETVLGKRINARVFLGVNAAMVLITLVLILIPCVGTLRAQDDGGTAFRGLVAVVSVASLAALGLLYCVKKGDLSWLTSFQKENKDSMK